MTSLVRSTSPVLNAISAFDELRASILACKNAATGDVRLVLHDAHDALCRMQSELSGAEPSIPLSSVEALGRFKERLAPRARSGAFDQSDLSRECSIAAAHARQALARIAEGERRLSITSESYVRRLSQFLIALSRTR